MFHRIRRKSSVLIPLLLIMGLLAACAMPGGQAPAAPAAEAGGEQATATDERALPADAAPDQTLHYVTRNFSRLNPAAEGGFGRPFISFMWMTFFLRDR